MGLYGVPPDTGGETSRIEIEFALPVTLTDEEMRQFCEIVQKIAKRHQPEGWVHWQSGCGGKRKEFNRNKEFRFTMNTIFGAAAFSS